jgi:hypothetical protein
MGRLFFIGAWISCIGALAAEGHSAISGTLLLMAALSLAAASASNLGAEVNGGQSPRFINGITAVMGLIFLLGAGSLLVSSL